MLRIASWFYGVGVVVRLGMYRIGLLASHSADVPVICIGNLTTGGTGKTPAVAWLARELRQMGRKPCIVSRGYKSNGGTNDELRVLAEICPGVPHIQDPDRVTGARRAVSEGADVVILDDGFSHVRLRRDLDILLLDSLNPFGFGRLLPRGLLREPIRNARRARFTVFSRADVARPERLHDLEDTLRCKGFFGGIAHAAHVPVELRRIGDGELLPPESLAGKTVAAFCGIGNPRGFQRTIEACGATISAVGLLQLDDHQQFDEALIAEQLAPFLRASREAGATMALCTQKDAVKLRELIAQVTGDLPIYELRVEFQVIKGEDELLAALTHAFAK
jgi:tetraacyldisaccharide 4'-kinase